MSILFRKKPVVIEAFRFGYDDRATWFEDAMLGENATVQAVGDLCWIRTLEGTMKGKRGDWIIRGVKGEIYPCKPDIFAATYEPVEP